MGKNKTAAKLLRFPEPKFASSRRVVLTRPTSESEIEVEIDSGVRREIQSDCQLHFLNHMLEHLSMRSCLNFKVKVGLTRFKLTHVITEDLGITIGRALLLLLAERVKDGVATFGVGSGILDEALARSTISVEGRAGYHFHDSTRKAEQNRFDELVEDMQAHDLETFIEGMTHGMTATVHVELLNGRNPHHIWEAIFRSLGEALAGVFAPCPWRAGRIAAIKGSLF